MQADATDGEDNTKKGSFFCVADCGEGGRRRRGGIGDTGRPRFLGGELEIRAVVFFSIGGGRGSPLGRWERGSGR